jgi:hypothetical protein
VTDLLRNAIEAELAASGRARLDGDIGAAFLHLERAHILSQRRTGQHVRVHWRMLKLGLAAGDRREVLGQATRIVAAALFSRIWIPEGNTGRANVSALQPMPVADDLRAILDQGSS